MRRRDLISLVLNKEGFSDDNSFDNDNSNPIINAGSREILPRRYCAFVHVYKASVSAYLYHYRSHKSVRIIKTLHLPSIGKLAVFVFLRRVWYNNTGGPRIEGHQIKVVKVLNCHENVDNNIVV